MDGFVGGTGLGRAPWVGKGDLSQSISFIVTLVWKVRREEREEEVRGGVGVRGNKDSRVGRGFSPLVDQSGTNDVWDGQTRIISINGFIELMRDRSLNET